jgi:hypothetical protein
LDIALLVLGIPSLAGGAFTFFVPSMPYLAIRTFAFLCGWVELLVFFVADAFAMP